MAPFAASVATTAFTLLSTVHGRDRREQRKIGKHDLKAAVKYGYKERTYGYKNELRWKYTFSNIVYITDDASRIEITSFVLPISIEPVAVTAADKVLHERAAAKLRSKPGKCTSHVVLVIDQSGSMRTCDVTDHKTRSDAVFGCVALDLLGRQIDSGACTSALTDAVSLIEMRDDATTVFEREPMTNVLFNKILRRKTEAHPSSHGNYLPALDQAIQIMEADRGNSACALVLLFLSDGRPSNRFTTEIEPAVASVARDFGGQLTVAVIGFGGQENDFAMLRRMAGAASTAGAHSTFSFSGSDSTQLSTAITKLSSRLSSTRTRLTALTSLAGPRTLRTARVSPGARAPGRRAKDPDDLTGWVLFPASTKQEKFTWDRDRGWVEHPMGGVTGVAVGAEEEGRGAERIVYQLTHYVKSSTSGNRVPVGDRLVAKQSLWVEDDWGNKDFHYVFAKTQMQAGRFAKKFNDVVADTCSVHGWQVPAEITFLDCCVYWLHGKHRSESIEVLVEKMLDSSRWNKWNSNSGYVHTGSSPGHRQAAAQTRQDSSDDDEGGGGGGGGMPAITEGSDSECEHDEEGERQDEEAVAAVARALHRTRLSAAQAISGRRPGSSTPCPIKPDDFPQAFSHYSYHYSQRASLVCDLQGTLDTSVSPSLFEFTDPVIHHQSMHGRRRVYGRTDHGSKGMQKFFETHVCNALCRHLGLPNDGRRNHGAGRPR
ncbi:hypothetical protein FOA52_003396 [Chlamydomonas sp. UWO 241]|nr:hypothetical protein FOA52_003396 [Chlamydomonas sp. UWO 241]